MLNHVKQFVQDIIDGKLRPHTTYQDACFTLSEELNRIDPIDLVPSVRSDFLHLKTSMASNARRGVSSERALMEELKLLIPILDGYGGTGSGKMSRSFVYLHDADLRTIIERDYVELTVVIFPAGAWKSTVVMAGSVLEAILHDVLSHPKRVAAANATPHALSIRAKKGLAEKGGWDLIDMIKASAEPPLSVLTKERVDTIDQVLRDYRNFVHPKKEIRAKHECGEPEAGLARYGLDGVCDHFQRTL